MNLHFLLRSHGLYQYLLYLTVLEQFVLGLGVVSLMDSHSHLLMIEGEVPLIKFSLEHSTLGAVLLQETLNRDSLVTHSRT